MFQGNVGAKAGLSISSNSAVRRGAYVGSQYTHTHARMV
eukprot:COSAG01_NODE_55271_length_326_cov_0.898678_2_plen_38_part_01